MTEIPAVLFANDAFYVAFSSRDIAAMNAAWATAAPVSCIHPGGNALAGRAEVMASWRSILGNRGAPKIRCHAPAARVFGDIAVVVCYEELDRGYLAATNIFLREGGRWKMVHHQAAPTPRIEGDDGEAPDRIQ